MSQAFKRKSRQEKEGFRTLDGGYILPPAVSETLMLHTSAVHSCLGLCQEKRLLRQRGKLKTQLGRSLAPCCQKKTLKRETCRWRCLLSLEGTFLRSGERGSAERKFKCHAEHTHRFLRRSQEAVECEAEIKREGNLSCHSPQSLSMSVLSASMVHDLMIHATHPDSGLSARCFG